MTVWANSIVSEERMGFSESRLVDQPGAGVIQIFTPTRPELIQRPVTRLKTPPERAGSSILVGQAFQPDIPDVRLESLTYERHCYLALSRVIEKKTARSTG